jgi:hypothetical protein
MNASFGLLPGLVTAFGKKSDRGEFRMNREATTLVDDVKQDSVEKIDTSALRGAGRNTSQPSGSAGAAQKRSLGERIKGLFASVAKALEGDHGTHNFRS